MFLNINVLVLILSVVIFISTSYRALSLYSIITKDNRNKYGVLMLNKCKNKIMNNVLVGLVALCFTALCAMNLGLLF